MTATNNVILNHAEINHKIRRIAFQIYESNVNENEIIKISDINPILCKVNIDKKNPWKDVKTSLSTEDYSNKSIVLVDDVLNSGTTLIYGVKHFLGVPLKQFKTAVLVNRNHKKYPVKADFKGISLSTSLHEHINVILEGNVFQAILE